MQSSAQEMVQAAKDYGYAGIFVTNHAWYGNTSVERRIGLCHGRNGCMGSVRLFIPAKAYGDKIGLSAFFGYESCYQGTEFLIYGVDEEWLLTHPEIKDATITEQLQLVREQGGLVMHAHPFREEAYIPRVRLFPGAGGWRGGHQCNALEPRKHLPQ